jgi:hypothetical protein
MTADNAGGERLVVQLPVSESTDFDFLIGVEDGIVQLFEKDRSALVDGHDIGQGRFNIFITPSGSWAPALGRIRAFLEFRGDLENAVVARRPGATERYEVVWPGDYRGTFEL